MSISTNPFFADVALGSRHEERLRSVLLTDAEIDEDDFPILLAAPTLNGENLAQCLIRPDHVRHANNRTYRCVISGMIFTFIVGSAPLTKENRYLSLRRKSWIIMRPTVEEVPFLATVMTELGQANKIRKQNNPAWVSAES